MLNSLRLSIVEPLTAGGYMVLLIVAFFVESREGWVGSLSGMAVLAFAAWLMSYRRARLIADTPTSKIASAAQGYVELVGRGMNFPNSPLLSKITALPCLWYRFVIEQKTGDNKWERVDSGTSSDSFLIDDGTGRCLIDPENAEVIPRRKDTWMDGNFRYTEWMLLPQAKIYAIGYFSTIGGANSDLNLSRDVSALLTQWKADRTNLLQRFDLDGDGNISEDEWLLARAQARRDVKKQHHEIRLQSGTNMLHKPRDGRLFMISDINPDSLARRYQIWTLFHLVAFIGSVGVVAWLTA